MVRAVSIAAEEVELIIFDCDGVLIDSEIISCRVDAEALGRLGISMSTEEVIRRFSGVSQKDMREIIERETQRPLPVDHDESVAKRERQVM
ncbi:MAG: HAD hydrolase-like protein, partial [Nitratireductor sp.]